MKNILVLTDFSEKAKSAALYAMNLAKHIEADVFLCHTLEITDQLTYPIADHLVLRNDSMRRLRALGHELQDRLDPYPKDIRPDQFQPKLTFINDLDMLTEVTEKIIDGKSVGLVIIGTHKSQGLSRFFLGSHTNDILDNVRCPVLLVPESAVFRSVRTIAYATDLTFNNTKVIKYLAELAANFNAEISINHISPLDLPLIELEENIEGSSITHLMDDTVRLSYNTIKGNNIPKGLIEICDSDKVDILTLVHKRYDFFSGLFHSSISKQLAHSINIPLLVMPYSFSLNDESVVLSD